MKHEQPQIGKDLLSLPIESYTSQLAEKANHLRELLQPYSPPQLTLFSSPKSHYRLRAEFRVWHSGADLYQIFRDQRSGAWVRVDQFPIACELINCAMGPLLEMLREEPTLRRKLFRIDYLATLSGELLISLIYHRQLDDSWVEAATWLRNQLVNLVGRVQIVGRALKQKISLERDWLEERLPIQGREFIYRQVEGGFTQPNGRINIQMLEWATAVFTDPEADLLELYCGNGNFTIPLAGNFRAVLASEVNKAAVATANHNLAINQVNNVRLVRLAASEVVQAFRKERIFRRLSGLDLSDYRCNSLLVDPPRSGIDQETLNWAGQYSQILYISCNPRSLCADLGTLARTHKITSCALFDQFPYTSHIECGVALRRL